MENAIGAGEDERPSSAKGASLGNEAIMPAVEPVNSIEPEDYTLRWDEVKPFARDLFKVWWDGSELQWAQTAWEHVIAAGYANGEMGKEYCQARLRLLALATLYADWCFLATDENPEPEVEGYVKVLALNPFYLGLLLEPDYELDGQDRFGFHDDEIALANAVRELVCRERPIVAKALLAGFGGPSQLFISLWRTQCPPVVQEDEPAEATTTASNDAPQKNGIEHTPSEQFQLWDLIGTPTTDSDDEEEEDFEDDEQDDAALSDDEILNTVTAEKAQVWDWITNNCPPL
jgi:hypothetical protein